MGALPAALPRPLPPVPFIAEHVWDWHWLDIFWLQSTRNLREGRMAEGRGRRRFLWINLGRAAFSSPYSYWPSLLLHSKSWSQSRSSCRPESSFILLPFWNLILIVFRFGVGKMYGSIVCAWVCTPDLSTPSCQYINTIYSKSKRFIAHLPEILPLWTLPGIIIIIIITTTTILAGLQDTPLVTYGSSGSQPSLLVALHKGMVAPFCSHLATAHPWSNRTFQQDLLWQHSAFGPGHPQPQHQHLASLCSLLSSVTHCLFSHSHLVLCKHFIRNK